LSLVTPTAALAPDTNAQNVLPNVQIVKAEEADKKTELVAELPAPDTKLKEEQPVETPVSNQDAASNTQKATAYSAPAVQQPTQLSAQTAREQVQAYAASIGLSDSWYAIDYIYSKESGWNPYAVNKTSGACGLNQELPCGKSGCALSDVLCQFRWGTNYANGRYGSWNGAYNFWRSNSWW
jgi:hypothetical protein